MGAGGPVGHAYHAGVLAAFHDAWGWDAREAHLIIGTSAGAGVGALLRAGLSPADLVARVTGRPLNADAQAIARNFVRPRKPAPDAGPLRWPGSRRYLAQACLQPWKVRPGRLAAALLPEGRVCLQEQANGLRRVFGDTWPDRALWITAVGIDCGSRVVFGRADAPLTDVGTAVISSSAVPSICRPIAIGSARYADGGIASPTHLDLVVDAPEIDTVLVLSPLSRMPGMARLLRREVRRIRDHGVGVVCAEPGPGTRAAMGWNPLDLARAGAVAEAAREEVGESLARLSASPTEAS
jgi:NTE family protein